MEITIDNFIKRYAACISQQLYLWYVPLTQEIRCYQLINFRNNASIVDTVAASRGSNRLEEVWSL